MINQLLLTLGTAITIVVIVVAFIAFWVWRWSKRMCDGLELCALPSSVKLKSLDARAAAQYNTSAAASLRIERWQNLGFEPQTRWLLDNGVSLTVLHLLTKSQSDLFVIVSDDHCYGTWSELYRSDGPSLTISVTNKPQTQGFSWMPGEYREFHDGALENELLTAMNKHRKTSAPAEVEHKPEHIRWLLESQTRLHLASVYAKADWKEFELRQLLAEAMDIDITNADAVAEHLQITVKKRKQLLDSMRWKLVDVCADQFLRQPCKPLPSWWADRERLHVVHDRLDADALSNFSMSEITQYFGVTDHLKNALKKHNCDGGTVREHFKQLNKSLPKGNRYRHIGALDWLVSADIYITPLSYSELEQRTPSS